MRPRRLTLFVLLVAVMTLAPAAVSDGDTGKPASGYTVTGGGTGTGTAPTSPTKPSANLFPLSETGIKATTGSPFDGLLVVFADTDTSATTSTLTAEISWGDGAKTSGTIVEGKPGVFGITGSHVYAGTGSYPITILLSSPADGELHLDLSATVGLGSTFTLGLGRPSVVGSRTLAVRLSCPRTEKLCRGRLTVHQVLSGHSRVLGSVVFLLPGGRTATLNVSVPARTLHRLERHHGASLKISATANDPATDRTGSGQEESLAKLLSRH
jgi:hypothetical protein